MRKRISDLLDACQDDSVELSGNTPLSSARIKELTMNKITPKKKHLYRLPARLLAAAAIVAALTASAFAAVYIAGAGELMQGFFAKDGDPLTSGQIESLDQVGQIFEDGVTDNGATITPVAALADEHCYYLRLRVEAPEGTVLPDLDPDVDGFYQFAGRNWPEEKLTLTGPDGGDLREQANISIMFDWLPDEVPTDNMKEAVIKITPVNSTNSAVAFNDGTSKVLTIPGLWVQSPYKEYTPIFKGEFAFDIGKHFESRSLAVDGNGADYHDQTGYGFTLWLDRVELTPLSVAIWYRDNIIGEGQNYVYAGLEGMRIVLKDGTVFLDTMPWWEFDAEANGWDAETMMADGPQRDMDFSFPFEQPLDLDQVDYIQFGEHIIPVNADSAD